jgi:Holliday junction resolvase RusA-like endonuclease
MQEAGIERSSGRLAVIVTAIVAIPKSYRGKQRTDALFGYSYPSGDVDNYAKSALDGLNNVVWEDDKQVVQLAATKAWGEEGETVIEVRYLDDHTG